MNLRYTSLLSVLILAGCGGPKVVAAEPTDTPILPTATHTPTSTITLTPGPSYTPTPTWVPQGPGQVQVPIFMYHHVGVSPIGSRYYVAPEDFRSHLQLLHDWGYSTISTSMLVEAITTGVSLPPHPIILTFDDANEDNYTNAFPIMQEFGFTGVLYVPVAYIGTPNYLDTKQIAEMAGAGWEVGSHTINHPTNFLALEPAAMRAEIVGSRKMLEDRLDLPILTFAYPFGNNSGAAVDYVHFAGYIAGMGATGFTADQGPSNLFVLQRVEIRGSETAASITRFLPWLGDPAFLPTATPTATSLPTRTPIPTYTQYPTKTPLGAAAP